MMKSYAILLALAGPGDPSVLPAEAPITKEPPHKLLVIEVPDGVRGGRGRIEGEGRPFYKIATPYSVGLPAMARECGAQSPMFWDNQSHSVHVLIPSTSDDRKIVMCLKAKMPTDVNAGLAESDERWGFTDPDPSAFLDFEKEG